jgi:hypothetical protein
LLSGVLARGNPNLERSFDLQFLVVVALAVTAGTIPGRWFVEENPFPVHISKTFVTQITSHFHVRAFQRKIRAGFMIEQRGFPSLRIVTSLTIHRSCRLCELAAMDVLMAFGTFRGRRAEIDFLERASFAGGLMTFLTPNLGVRTAQLERGLRVVEPRQIGP